MEHLQYLRSIKTLPALIKYLREELNWPIESDDFDEITFDYSPDELGIDEKSNVKIKEIKQLRPLANDQPWGIFFINFEPKQLPVVVLRRILRSLVIKKRASANAAGRKMWQLNDLLFISSYGDQKERAISFANFSENVNSGELPSLKVLGWDDDDTILHLDDVHRTLKEKLCWPPDTNDIKDWRNKWSGAFTIRHREVISTSRDLAIEMAHLATKIRKRVNLILKLESDNGSFTQLLKAFRTALIHDLTRDDFADMYAQTITYGLLAAKVSRPALVLTENLADLVSNPFLKETLGMFLKYGGKKDKVNFDEAGILEVADLLNSPNTHIEAILHDFGNKTQREDPVIHFYELFLTEYDKEKKIERGVFYTPQPVVSFIVRSVHEILQNEFGLEDGLASTITWGEMQTRNKHIEIPNGVSPNEPFVTILDPAVGTGTFLVEVIDVIAKHTISKWEKAGFSQKDIQKLWDEYVSKALLPRIYGFELMMAPYVITDIKLTLKLTEISRTLGELFYRNAGKVRFNIFLTNSLEGPTQTADKKLADMFTPLAHESLSVNEIKRNKNFQIIIGNPPYSVNSNNKSEWIGELMVDYKKDMNERNIQPLSDDYIKFIRFGQYFIDKNKSGVLAYITNNSLLDGIIHRQMRKNLLESFNNINILNLHGNLKINEVCPDGSPDHNVFDIMQGVSINIFVKKIKKTKTELGQVFSFDLQCNRDSKYDFLNGNCVNSVKWECLNFTKPNYFYVNKNFDGIDEYEKYFDVSKLFLINSVGVVTSCDNKILAENIIELKDKIKYYFNEEEINDEKILNYLYRPFETKKIYYEPKYLGRSRENIMKHYKKDNIGLIVSKQFGGHKQFILFVTNSINDKSSQPFAPYYNHPLYLYPDKSLQQTITQTTERTPNLNQEIPRKIAAELGLTFTNEKETNTQTFAPIDILDYIYAILHSPAYTEKYKEFLKINFPRVPYPKDANQFWQLVSLGAELRQIHLLVSEVVNKFITTYLVNGDNAVDKVKYENKKVWINKKQYFDNVPAIAWEFYIGGYQPAQKWLKDRKGRKLSKEDIEHYQKIIVALTETDRIMKEIDKVL